MDFDDMVNNVIQGDCLDVMKDIPDSLMHGIWMINMLI